jgi:porphobilinogen synthase
MSEYLPYATFPAARMRRLRRTTALRKMVAETNLSVNDLIMPVFVREGIEEPRPILSLPGVVQHSRGSIVAKARELVALGVPAMVVFGVPLKKDSRGSGAYDNDGIVQIVLREVRDKVGDDLVLISDLCLDEYTDHGHCGLLTDDGEVDNDATIELYGQIALAQAAAGADIVAPSGMMDGQIQAIRSALDGVGYVDTAILAYAAKYASTFYGPFRDAVDVTIAGGGDRRAYQQDPANRREALREVALDVAEGADMVMVKPALPYLDILADVRRAVDVPVSAYQVSGEYAMICAAAERGWIDREGAALETLTAIKRAGADQILTYFAAEVAAQLNA